MFVIQFFENNHLVLSQLLRQIPSVNQNIKIKGRKGKVLTVNKMDDNLFHVHVTLEKVVKAATIINDNKKKKR